MIRYFAIGLLVGGLLGLWFGINIGKGRAPYTNPFLAAQPVQIEQPAALA